MRIDKMGWLAGLLLVTLAGCGGGGSGSSFTTTTTVPPPVSTASLSVLYAFGSASNTVPIAGLFQGSLMQASDGNFYGEFCNGGAYNKGYVYRVTPAGNGSVVYSFGATANDAVCPESLLQATDGNLYGMSSGATGVSEPAVFKLTLNGVESIVYTSPSTNGVAVGSLIQGNDGNFYGAGTGGAYGQGVVLRLTTSGILTVLYAFGAGASDVTQPAGLIQINDGSFYGIAYGGGANGKGGIFKVTSSGVETVMHAFGADANDGYNPNPELLQASDSNVYGTTQLGGSTASGGTVFKITPSSGAYTNFSGPGIDANGFFGSPVGGLIQAKDGNLYGVTSDGSPTGSIFMVTLTGSETIYYYFGLSNQIVIGSPQGALIQAGDGHLYGMADGTGSYISGVIYKIN